MSYDQIRFLQPHAVCYAGNTKLIDIVVFSHSIIFAAYTIISLVLVMLIRGKKARYKPIWYGFSAFIMACGVSHLMHVVAIYTASAFWPEAWELECTAAISLTVAMGMLYSFPGLRQYFGMLDELVETNADRYLDILTTQNLSEHLQKENNKAVENALRRHQQRGGDTGAYTVR